MDDTDFTNANMFQVNFVSSKSKHHNLLGLFTKITPVLTSISDMYSEEKIKLVESCLNELGDITEEQLKIMKICNYRIYTKSNSNRSIRK